MISTALAARLRDAGLRWTPTSGDSFQIDGHDFEGDVFTVSDMTIEPHHYPSGTILGFNGTTEWALDSVALDDALWLPREDQLRDALAGTFESLTRRPGGAAPASVEYVVAVEREGRSAEFSADDPAEAYGLALLDLMVG
jgi:hypothetical protein